MSLATLAAAREEEEEEIKGKVAIGLVIDPSGDGGVALCRCHGRWSPLSKGS